MRKAKCVADILRAALADLDRMFKSLPPWILETEADREAQRLQRRVRGNTARMAQFDRDLEVLAKSFAPSNAPRVVAVEVHEAPARDDGIVAKAINVLRHDVTISARDRGMLILALGDHAGAAFAKSEAPHPLVSRLDKVREMLERAHREGKAKRGEPIIKEALEHIKRGVVDSADFNRLSVLLSELKSALAAGDDDAL